MKVSSLKPWCALLALIGVTAFAPPLDAQTVILSDDWSDNEVLTPTYRLDPTVQWVINHGQFAANGSQVDSNYLPQAGSLNFGRLTALTRISIDLKPNLENYPVTVTFSLQQHESSTGNYPFLFGFTTAAYNSYYLVAATPNATSLGTTGIGLHATNSAAPWYSTAIAGNAGMRLNGNSNWQEVSVTFDPTTGITARVRAIGGEWQIAGQWANTLDWAGADRFMMVHKTAGVSWFVDNLSVTVATPAPVPEPQTVALLALGVGWLLYRGGRRHHHA